MGLRSGDWLGHSRTLKCFLRSLSFVAQVVCLGSLSYWKTQPRFIFNALADGRRFSLKISRYMAPFILSFTQISRPCPFAEKQPQSMMFPPPSFTVGMVFFGCNSAFFLLQTRQVEFLPKSYIDHMTFSHIHVYLEKRMFWKVLRHVFVPSSGLDENNIKGSFSQVGPYHYSCLFYFILQTNSKIAIITFLKVDGAQLLFWQKPTWSFCWQQQLYKWFFGLWTQAI